MPTWWGCADSSDVANRDSAGTAIICFGDSLTQGVGASPGHDYPSLLARALGKSVINAGSSGETTRDGLARLQTDVLARDPQLVIVEFGGNDFLQQVPRAETFANLEVMVQQIQARGAMVVVLGVEPLFLQEEAHTAYRRLAQTSHSALVPDILQGILTRPTLRSDALHPNDAGYEQMTQRIATVVKPLLEH